jgi:DNA replication protein DnaC
MHRAVSAYKLLIIDEIGYLRMSREQANLFFQVVAQHYERGSDDPHLESDLRQLGLCLRRRQRAHRRDARSRPSPSTIVSINGESFRLKDKRRAGMLGAPAKVAEH